jgi:hypothetical protein
MLREDMAQHLAACPVRQKAMEEADPKLFKAETLYHLGVRDARRGDFWLYLEMPGSVLLVDLDHYLRQIWLECCGHLSMFSIGGWGGDEIPKNRRVSQVFTPGLEVTHIYDFGTDSLTLIKLVGTREGKPLTDLPVFLMARNNRPDWKCMVCDEPATWLRAGGYRDGEDDLFLCDEHVRDKEDEYEDYLYPLVNSPRVGLCGYFGPAEPPY